MPKYFKYKICGYYLYYTSFCIIECMHVHASDSKLAESGSAKFFVKSDGNTVVQKIGVLTDRGFGLFLHRISDEARIRYHSRLAA